MSSYQTRKAQRTALYQQSHGRKLITCAACSGTGVYDNVGTPPCSCCDGTGKVRESVPSPPTKMPDWRKALKLKNERAAVRERRECGGAVS